MAYGITDIREIDAFLALARDASKPGWWHSYDDVLPSWFRTAVGLEESASLIRSYQPQVVPGLLQTEGYTRAITAASFPAATEQETERRVALRLARQDLLRRPDPPGYWVVMDETVLRRPIGGQQVMRDQLAYLIEAIRPPKVTIQVIPFAAGWHPALHGMFNIYRFPARELPERRLRREPDRGVLPEQARRSRPLHRGPGPDVRPGRPTRADHRDPARHHEGDLR